MASAEGYLLDNQQAEAGRRFTAMAELFDPVTIRQLSATGIGVGWCCWEVGAGGPGIATWLAARVGRTGRVLATDIDTTWLHGPFEIARHDVAADPPPPGPFDLVPARLVLVHLPARGAAVAAMLAGLRPGGWLVVEDADPALQPLACPDEHGPDEQRANRLRVCFRTFLAQRSADLAFGRTLPRLLREAGLADVRAELFAPLSGPACRALEDATIRQIRGRLVAAGIATDTEIDAHLAALAAGRLDPTTAPLVSARGRAPAYALSRDTA